MQCGVLSLKNHSHTHPNFIIIHFDVFRMPSSSALYVRHCLKTKRNHTYIQKIKDSPYRETSNNTLTTTENHRAQTTIVVQYQNSCFSIKHCIVAFHVFHSSLPLCRLVWRSCAGYRHGDVDASTRSVGASDTAPRKRSQKEAQPRNRISPSMWQTSQTRIASPSPALSYCWRLSAWRLSAEWWPSGERRPWWLTARPDQS